MIVTLSEFHKILSQAKLGLLTVSINIDFSPCTGRYIYVIES
uniref:Uncharacterized protein n=1 Tax=Arundo donax TaxID=35708 RepID=A0A0A9CB21_ARUDO